jgi:pSer/pThr/pTyr-binding forkhead associated (FHA) protein
MPITVTVRHSAGEDSRLTFDGTQRVVIGRSSSSDVRLPDASVSYRHASIRAQGAEFAIVDEGSTNGTFVGEVRIAPHTSRLVRSGDRVRFGRIWIELRINQGPVTRDVAAATRDLALAMVSQAMAAIGADPTPRVRVVEGRDQGSVLTLHDEGRPHVIGRAAQCDLALSDPDASREHVEVVRRDGFVFVRDRATKNGTWLGEARLSQDREVQWRAANMIRIGRTVLALEEPISDALAEIERAPDEPLDPEIDVLPPPRPEVPGAAGMAGPHVETVATAVGAAGEPAGPPHAGSRLLGKRRRLWSLGDLLVMAAAVSVLALSLAGLVWLLRG